MIWQECTFAPCLSRVKYILAQVICCFWLKKTLIQTIVSDQTTCIIPVYWPIFYFLSLPPSHFFLFFLQFAFAFLSPPLSLFPTLPSFLHSSYLSYHLCAGGGFLTPQITPAPTLTCPALSKLPSMTSLLPPAPLLHDPPLPSLSGGNTKTTIPPTYLRSGSICPSLPPLRSDSPTSLPVSRCLLLFSPSKDGYAPKSVYPLRYVIVGSLLSLFVYLSYSLFLSFSLLPLLFVLLSLRHVLLLLVLLLQAYVYIFHLVASFVICYTLFIGFG